MPKMQTNYRPNQIKLMLIYEMNALNSRQYGWKSCSAHINQFWMKFEENGLRSKMTHTQWHTHAQIWTIRTFFISMRQTLTLIHRHTRTRTHTTTNGLRIQSDIDIECTHHLLSHTHTHTYSVLSTYTRYNATSYVRAGEA